MTAEDQAASGGTLRVDVIVIGAGPAGSAMAALLASRGADVVLVDRDKFPRDKLCGEFLSYDALPLLECIGVMQEIDAAGAPLIERCRIVGSRKAVELRLPLPARGVSRMLLDDVLIRAAAARGARRFDGWAVTAMDPSARRIVIERDGVEREIHAKVIVGAWGRWGRFDTQLERSFVQERSDRSFGFKRHYVQADLRSPDPVIALYPFNRGYLGVNAVEGGATNICGLVHAERLAGNKARWDGFVETIRKESSNIDRLFSNLTPAQENTLSSDPVIFLARSPVEAGVFLIGDASGVIDPLTGNGMAMAIQSAFIAAPHILRLLGGDSARSEFEDAYRREHGAFFAPRLRWSRRAAVALTHPRMLDAMLASLPSAAGSFLLTHTRAPLDAVRALLSNWDATRS